jgi:hypothetical protein
MELIFKYNRFKRLFPITIAPLFLLLIYVFLRAAFQEEDIFISMVYFSVSALLLFIWISILNHCRITITVNSRSIAIKRPFGSKILNWNNISEYGKDRVVAGYGKVWRYYIKSIGKPSKIIICHEDIVDFNILDKYISRKRLDVIP